MSDISGAPERNWRATARQGGEGIHIVFFLVGGGRTKPLRGSDRIEVHHHSGADPPTRRMREWDQNARADAGAAMHASSTTTCAACGICSGAVVKPRLPQCIETFASTCGSVTATPQHPHKPEGTAGRGPSSMLQAYLGPVASQPS